MTINPQSSKLRSFRATGCSLLVGLSLLLGGCAKTIAPSFTAVGVREIEQGNDRLAVDFIIEARNPNRESIPLRQINYNILIDGVDVFQGVRSPQTTLHSYSAHTFELPAVIPASAFAGSGRVAYTLVGTAQYIPPGRLSEVLFDAEMKVPEAVIHLTGEINLAD